jgi:hypothetical protein
MSILYMDVVTVVHWLLQIYLFSTRCVWAAGKCKLCVFSIYFVSYLLLLCYL